MYIRGFLRIPLLEVKVLLANPRGFCAGVEIAEAPPGSVVVYSAHGISPEIRRQSKQRNLTEIDATCPLVTKVHLEVLRFAKQGYTIFFIGHANHDEAVGTVGEAPHNIVVIESPEDVTNIPGKDETK